MKVLASPAYSNKNVNPYNYLLYTDVEKNGVGVTEHSRDKVMYETFDVVHYHWPDGFINQPSLFKSLLKIGVLLFCMLIFHIRKTAIVWTVHNIYPHDAYRPRLSAIFLKFLAARCDGLIFLSKQSRAQFFETYRVQKNPPASAVIPHGHYKSFFSPAISKDAARTALGLPLDEPVILFLGMIKPYKNVESLLTAFNSMKTKKCHLIVAGNPANQGLKSDIEKLAAQNPNIHLFLTFIPDADIALYMGAADFAVFPYKKVLNSGAILLALSFNVSVLAPALGSITELRDDLGADWVKTYDGDFGSALLDDALNDFSLLAGNRVCDLGLYDWDKLAPLTIDLYKAAIDHKRKA